MKRIIAHLWQDPKPVNRWISPCYVHIAKLSYFASGDFDISSGAVSIKDAGVGNDQLEFDSVTVTAGSGLTGGGSIALGSSVEIKLDSGAVKGLFSGGNNIDYNNSTGEISASVSGVIAGVYGNSTKIPVISVDSYGQVDSIGLIGAQASLGDTVDSIGFDSATGVFTIVTDVSDWSMGALFLFVG